MSLARSSLLGSLLLVLLIAGSTSAYSLLYQFNGTFDGDYLGVSLASADLNGDGKAEIIAGAPYGNVTNATGGLLYGFVRIYNGSNGSLLAQINGTSVNDYFGAAVATGDVTGDGVPDIAIGAYNGTNGTSYTGYVQIFNGSNLSQVLYQFNGSLAGDYFGNSLAFGDVDGNGRADLLVGAPRGGTGGLGSNGYARLFNGTTGAIIQQFNGSLANDALGTAVALGDVNGDGLAEVVLGAATGNVTLPSTLNGAFGYVRVFDNYSTRMLWQSNGTDGVSFDNDFGESLAVGDVNGDGRGDVIAGGPGGQVPYAGSLYGYVRVLNSTNGALLYQFNGTTIGDRLGSAVAARDVNGDGKAEVFIGAYAGDAGFVDNGYARVYNGSNGAILTQFNGSLGSEWLGYSVAFGDVNGNGNPEFIVGAYKGILSNRGYVRVYQNDPPTVSLYNPVDGAVTTDNTPTLKFRVTDPDDLTFNCTIRIANVTLTNVNASNATFAAATSTYISDGVKTWNATCIDGANNTAISTNRIITVQSNLRLGLKFKYQFNGSVTTDSMGVVATGDVDGDGIADIAAGASGGSVAGVVKGYVRVFNGSTGAQIYEFDGTKLLENFGKAVAMQDVDGDGKADILVGTGRGNDVVFNPGNVSVFSGATGSLLYRFTGGLAGDDFGSSVAGADVDGDGKGDIIAGAPLGNVTNATGGLTLGYVRVLSGANGSLLYQFNGSLSNDLFGFSVAAADFEGNGRADIVVGVKNGNVTSTNNRSGYVRVFNGSSGALLRQLNGSVNNEEFGGSVAVGDVDGDGALDIIVGAGNLINTQNGSVRVYNFSNGALLYQFNGTSNSDDFGVRVAAGDLDGDGKSDLIVTADNGNVTNATGGVRLGYLRVISGSSGAQMFQFNGTDGAPFDVWSGDVDGNGVTDLLYGAPAATVSGITYRGFVRAYVGVPDSPPAIVLNSPANNSLVNTSTPSFNFTVLDDVDTAGLSCTLFVDGANKGSNTTVQNNTPTVIVSNAMLSDANHTWNVNCTDSAGNLNSSATRTVNVSSPPVVTLLTPSDGVVTFAGRPTMSFRAVDNDLTANCTLNIANVSTGPVNITTNRIASIASTTVPEGANTWNVSCTDPGGNSFTTANRTITINTALRVTYQFSSQINGSSDGSDFGPVAIADVDGDGNADIIIGAYNALGSNGSVYVYSGLNGSLLYQFNGSTGERLGIAVAAGDVDGDGNADIVAGGFSFAANNFVRVFSGANGSQIFQVNGPVANDDFGKRVAAADVNRDGKAEVIVSAMVDQQVRIYDRTGAQISLINGLVAGFGTSLAAGDVNGDGYADVAVGVPGANANIGYVDVLNASSGTLICRVDGLGANDNMGKSVGLADVTGDGRLDILAGAEDGDTNGLVNNGYVRAFNVTSNGSTCSQLFQVNGTAQNQALGISVAGGDFDGDGRADVIVGVKNETPVNRGSVKLLNATNRALLFQSNGTLDNDYFGMPILYQGTVIAVGDLNGDGMPDFVAGAPLGSAGGFATNGYVRVFLTTPDLPPAIALNSPANASIANTPPVFNFTVTDDRDASGLNCSMFVNGVNVGNNASVLNNTPTTFSPSQTDGIKLWNVTCIDSAGNVNTSQTRTLNVSIPLVLSLYTPIDNATTTDLTPHILFHISDNDPIANCTLYANATTTGPVNVSSSTFVTFGNMTSTALAPGDYVWNVTCAAGEYSVTTPNRNLSITSLRLGQQMRIQLNGSAAGGSVFGTSVAMGDVNNDGQADLVVGAPSGSTGGLAGNGYVQVYNGSNGALLYQFNGTYNGDKFGTGVAVGDVDRDGYGDIIVGASDGHNLGFTFGYVQVFSGRNGSRLYWINGSSIAPLNLGYSIASGDINHDGYADIIAGAPNAGANGQVRVYYGNNGSIAYSIIGDSGTLMGFSVAAGDVNGDGFADVIAGESNGNAGAFGGGGFIRVVYGNNGTLMYQKNGSTYSEFFGYSVAAGDLNGDGKWEFAAGAEAGNVSGNVTGYVRVFNGSNGALLYQFNGTSAGDSFGYGLSMGDVNGDDKADILVGARSGSSNGLANNGYVRIFNGSNGAQIFQLNSPVAGDTFGTALATGDVNGNGLSDLLAGADNGKVGGAVLGYARAYQGIGDAPPTVSLNSPAGSSFTNNSAPSFNFTVTDDVDVAGINCSLYVDGLYNATNATVFANAPTVLAGSALADGAHSWNVTCIDSAGNVNTSATRTLSVDTVPPVVAQYRPTDTISTRKARPLFQFRVLDAVSTTTNCTLHVGTVDTGPLNVTNNTLARITSNTLAGYNGVWNVTCVDLAGNIGTSSNRTILVSPNASVGLRLRMQVNGTVVDQFGQSIAFGDVDGDGYDDLIVGSYNGSVNNGGGNIFAGYVRVFSGIDGALLYQLNGTASNDQFGFAVASADVNGDGFADVIVGAPNQALLIQPGYAKVFYGNNGSLMYWFNGTSNGDDFGNSAAGGDVDGDGRAEVFVGAYTGQTPPGYTGYVRAYNGSTGAMLYQVNGSAHQDDLGTDIAVADGNNDGRVDLLVAGSPQTVVAGAAGYAMAFSALNGSLLYWANGSAVNHMGGKVTAGDVDGDGNAEMMAASNNPQYLRVFNGSNFSLPYYQIGGAAYDFGFGGFVTGDVNGDGLNEIMASSPTSGPVVGANGSVSIINGFNSSKLYWINGTASTDNLGRAIATGDANGDGLADLAAGGKSAANIGFVRVFETYLLAFSTLNVTLNAPADNANTNVSTVTFQYTPTVNGTFINATLYANFSGAFVANVSNATALANNTLNNLTVAGVPEGRFAWNVLVYANDTGNIASGFATANRTLVVDLTPPSIALNSPANRSFTNNATPTFNFTVTDTRSSVTNCSVYVNGVNVANVTNAVNNTPATVVSAALSDGVKSWNVVCADLAGNAGVSASYQLTVDTVPPQVSLSFPANLNVTSNTTPSFGFTQVDVLSPNATCTLNVGNVSTGPVTAFNNTLTSIISNALVDGSRAWNVTCTDLAGNANTSSNRTIGIDTTPPAVVLNGPVNNSVVNNGTPSFQFTALDTASNNMSCVLAVGTQVLGPANAPNNTPTNLTAALLADGVYSWNVTCTDQVGNFNVTGSNVMTIDTIVPTVALVSPSDNSNLSVSSLNFSYTPVSTGTYLVATLYSNFTGVFGANVSNTTVMTNNSQNNLSVAGLPEGRYVWNVRISTTNETPGAVENVTAVANRSLTIDRSAPVVSLLSPANNSATGGTAPNFAFNVTDNLFANTACTLYVGNVTTGPVVIPNGTASAIVSNPLSAGVKVWNVSCIDSAGNIGISGNFNINIVTGTPSLVLNGPVDNGNFSILNAGFQFTPTNIGAFINATLYANFTGAFAANNSNATALVNITASNITVAGLPEGRFTWNVLVYSNESGPVIGSFAAANRTINIDRTAPVVTLNAPVDGFVSGNSTPLLQFTPTDNLANRVSCTVAIGNVVNGPVVVVNNTLTSVASAALLDGPKVWNVTCTDDAGNFAVSANRNIIIDSNFPAVSLNMPAAGLGTNATDVNFTYTPTSTGVFVSAVLMGNFTGAFVANVSNTTAVLNNTANNLSLVGINQGWFVWNVNVTSRNESGVLESVLSGVNRTLIVDRSVPSSVVLNSPADQGSIDGPNPVFGFTVTDNLGPTLTCTLNVGNTLTTVAGLPNGTATSITSNALAVGTYAWNVTCADAAGNANVSSNRTVTITQPPAPQSLLISSVAASGTDAGSDVYITVTWNTDLASNSRVEYGTGGILTTNSSINSTLVTNHSMRISGLNGGTAYSYRVYSCTGAVCNVSATSVVNTPGPAGTGGGGIVGGGGFIGGGGGGGGGNGTGGIYVPTPTPSATPQASATPGVPTATVGPSPTTLPGEPVNVTIELPSTGSTQGLPRGGAGNSVETQQTLTADGNQTTLDVTVRNTADVDYRDLEVSQLIPTEIIGDYVGPSPNDYPGVTWDPLPERIEHSSVIAVWRVSLLPSGRQADFKFTVSKRLSSLVLGQLGRPKVRFLARSVTATPAVTVVPTATPAATVTVLPPAAALFDYRLGLAIAVFVLLVLGGYWYLTRKGEGESGGIPPRQAGTEAMSRDTPLRPASPSLPPNRPIPPFPPNPPKY